MSSNDHVQVGDIVELDYGLEAHVPLAVRDACIPPPLGYGKHLALVTEVFGPGWEQPTDMPCILVVNPNSPSKRFGPTKYPDGLLVAIGDVGRIVSPLELLALCGEGPTTPTATNC